ncbi:hypothetical protein [Pseudomonas sp. SIMBA_068]|uniref:hypothetical protein n=1 Tax=Pseudomonas sp. SIMBA_068 TaxID=3085808 RepID=UPI00397B4D82
MSPNQGEKFLSPTSTILSLLLIFVTGSAHATGYDVQRFQSFRSLNSAEKERDASYLIGVSRGLVLASMYIEQEYAARLFCIPKNKMDEAYGGSISALSNEVANPSSGHPYAPDTPVEVVMLQALKTHYPCNN